MDYRTLGRTGISVSIMGLGCGGHSRLGLAQNRGEESAIGIVRQALECGVNFIDTAESYGTEEVVGKALRAAAVPRESVIISTKVSPGVSDRLRTGREVRDAVQAGLRRLQTDYVDVLHLHGVSLKEYDHCIAEFVPALQDLRAAGNIRFLGITEGFNADPGHVMLQRAVQDDIWDVMMVGFNLINQSARERVLAATQEKNIGTLDMFAVRRALSDPAALKTLLADLTTQGAIDGTAFDQAEPLGFLLTEGGAETIPDAAYRFCKYEPGIDVVLSGTGSREHLEDNVRSLERSPLPEPVVTRLRELFARVDSVTGN